jgi:8-oxo-dGTP pyrophosphatase MutT (NUDIX family)/phosphohistidine phosphatase SixA
VPDDVIRAAGAVLWRPAPDGSPGPQIALVHRPNRKDWSFPKGKLEPGEHPTAAAVREVGEETGYHVSLGRPLPSRRYQVDGVPKQVRYWAATMLDELPALFVPTEEIDELEWLDPAEAGERLSYPHDVELLPALARSRVDTVPLVVVRHAKAVKRAQWKGTLDAARPLDERGIAQARRLIPILGAYGIRAVHSSDATRCRDTVLPYARSRQLDIVDEPLLSEEGHAHARKASRARMAELLALPVPLVVCSHRPVLPDLLGVLDPKGAGRLQRPLAPGAVLVLHRAFEPGRTRVVAVERHRS